MKTSFVFQSPANKAVPRQWVYRKARKLEIATDKLTAELRSHMVAHGMAHEELVDVEVTFCELDDGVSVEWSVQLKPNCFTEAKTPYTVTHGYMARETLLTVPQYEVARQTAIINMNASFQWREQHVTAH